ncbi:MAG: hypothetical protein KDA41_03445 [Planctomycetales bacterium]|nr:hypothetical protein [Planctomycetales bacterium]
MLVIISDLHLTDGTSGASIHPGTFHIFAQRLVEMSERASWRTDGHYRPIDSVDLLLLGDAVDITRSAHWNVGAVKPWDDPHSPEAIETVAKIVDGVLENNALGLAVLRSLADEGVALAAGDSRGRPIAEGQPHIVPVNIHYMVGNHDWHLHLDGSSYDTLRRRIQQHMGLAGVAGEPFAHDPQESEELLISQRRHRLIARHGDVFDPLNFEGDRDGSSLGDVIVVQLVNRFGLELQQQLGDELPEAALIAMGEIDNIRPVLLTPVWIEGVLERCCPNLSTRKKVKRLWDELADEMLAMSFVRQRDTWSPFDLIDGLAGALKFSKRISSGWSHRILNWLREVRGAASASYYSHALAEPDFRNRRAQHIIYGHTHETETVPLDASYADSFVLNQMYFNTGTWRRVYRQTQHAPGEHEFIPSEAMTYLTFFQQDERGGCPFEVWSGMLGVEPPEGVSYRLDPAHTHASRESLSPSDVQFGGPHFAGRTAHAGRTGRFVG